MNAHAFTYRPVSDPAFMEQISGGPDSRETVFTTLNLALDTNNGRRINRQVHTLYEGINTCVSVDTEHIWLHGSNHTLCSQGSTRTAADLLSLSARIRPVFQTSKCLYSSKDPSDKHHPLWWAKRVHGIRSQAYVSQSLMLRSRTREILREIHKKTSVPRHLNALQWAGA